jgi:RIO kinase 1
LSNVTDYFKRKGVEVLSLKQLFDFVINPSFGSTEEEADQALEKVGITHCNSKDVARIQLIIFLYQLRSETTQMDELDKVDEEVFKQAYIPRNLEEVYDVDRDAAIVARGEGKDVSIWCILIVIFPGIYIDTVMFQLIYSNLLNVSAPSQVDGTRDAKHDIISGVLQDLKSPSPKKSGPSTADSEDSDESESEEEEEDSDEEDDSQDDSGDDSDFEERQPRGKRNEDKDAKKERKKQAKEEAREKRKKKLPKFEKKRKIKNSSNKKKK